MKLLAAIVLFAFAAAPVTVQNCEAQRGGGAHAGSSGGRGISGPSSFSGSRGSGFSGSGSSGFSRPGNFERPAQPVPYRALPYRAPQYRSSSGAGFQTARQPGSSNFRVPYNGNRFATSRPEIRSMSANASRGWDRSGDRAGTQNRDRDRNRGLWDARRRSFNSWYLTTFPWWLGYGDPYLIDPGFYDWNDADDSGYGDSGYGNSAYDQGNAAPYADYGAPYPDEPPQQGELPPWDPQGQQAAAAWQTAPAAPAPEQPLTVFFKSGRAPVKIQNYIMTGKLLTDLDARHYEQIPVDQIDVAETQRVNSAAGVEFQVPGASRD
jgi:hypothetical protein